MEIYYSPFCSSSYIPGSKKRGGELVLKACVTPLPSAQISVYTPKMGTSKETFSLKIGNVSDFSHSERDLTCQPWPKYVDGGDLEKTNATKVKTGYVTLVYF